MFTIKTKISLKDKELIQTQYIYDQFIVTELNGKKIIFITGSNLFSVNTENKSLKAIDISQQVEQINKVKTMLGILEIENIGKSDDILGYKTKSMKFYNNNETIKFSMTTFIITVSGIENTVYTEFMKLEQDKQLVNFKLEPNEIIASMSSEIFMQGNLVQSQSMEIVSIESELEDNNEFYEYLTYSHEQ